MSTPTYGELLRDPRWQRKRLEIMNRADFACEECGDKTTTLNVHHKIYLKGAKPWEYENVELECLCETCHEATHHLRDALRAATSSMSKSELERLLGYADALQLINIATHETRVEKLPIKVRSEHHAAGLIDGVWDWNSGGNLFVADCLIDHRVLDKDLLLMLGEGEMPSPDWKAQH